ncbi:MAG: DUF3754 domain-containing protein [Gemmataceae bacterium]
MRAAREPFIPVHLTDLVELLLSDRGPTHDNPLSEAEQAAFRKFADRTASRIHAAYQDQFRKLKAAYAPFDPDCDLSEVGIDPCPQPPPPGGEGAGGRGHTSSAVADLFERFAVLMKKANFHRLTRDELIRLMQGASEWGVDMHVPWDAYEQVDVFVRGAGPGRRTRRKWYRLFRAEEVTVPAYSRVVIILKQRPHKQLGADADTGHVFVKLFKDIPVMDLEMLLPGTRIKMPLLDRIRLGGTGLGSLGYVVFKLQTMASPLLKAVGLVATGAAFGEQGVVGLIALYTPLALIGGYAYRTYASFNTTKRSYQLQLSQSLYYQNLDNNAGVLHRLRDAAEEQEIREALLAYFFLWRYAGERGWADDELDQYTELDLARRVGKEIDFDVADAVAKLEAAGLVTRTNGRLVAVPIEDHS